MHHFVVDVLFQLEFQWSSNLSEKISIEMMMKISMELDERKRNFPLIIMADDE